MFVVSQLRNFLRLNEFSDKITFFIFSVIMLHVLTGREINYESVFYVFVLQISLMYFFTLNSVNDRRKDLKVGRDNYFGILPVYAKLIVLFEFLIYILFLLIFYVINVQISITYLIFLIIGTIYSLNPIKLKHSVFGFSYSLAFPLFVFIYTLELGITNHVVSGFFILWGFLFQFRKFLEHHIADYKNDIKTKSKTPVTILGLKKSKSLLKSMKILHYVFLPIVAILINILLGVTTTLAIYLLGM